MWELPIPRLELLAGFFKSVVSHLPAKWIPWRAGWEHFNSQLAFGKSLKPALGWGWRTGQEKILLEEVGSFAFKCNTVGVIFNKMMGNKKGSSFMETHFCLAHQEAENQGAVNSNELWWDVNLQRERDRERKTSLSLSDQLWNSTQKGKHRSHVNQAQQLRKHRGCIVRWVKALPASSCLCLEVTLTGRDVMKEEMKKKPTYWNQN